MKRHDLAIREGYGSPVRWLARLALFSLIFQIAALGHWGGDKLTLAEAAKHAQHCHGENATCGSGVGGAIADHVEV